MFLNKHSDNEILKLSNIFYKTVLENKDSLEKITIKDYKYFDIESNPELFDGYILPKLTTTSDCFVNTGDAIGDIINANIHYNINKTKGKYSNYLNKVFNKNSVGKSCIIKNHERRNHNSIIRSRFRFYQVIEQFQNGLKKASTDLIKGNEVSKDIITKLSDEFSKHKLIFINNETEVFMYPRNIDDVLSLMKSRQTKKHSQRAIKEFDPAPAQLLEH